MALPPGYTLVALDHVDSTNQEARRRIAAGAAHGTVIRAVSQSRGRGRRGRLWVSPPGNLYATLILRPGPVPALGQLSFVAAVAVADALAPTLPISFKWPNDVLLDGAKVGGILIEAVGDDRGGGEEALAVAVGIGVNCASAPQASEFPAACLPDAPDPAALLEEICRRFDGWYRSWRQQGFVPVREAWLARAAGIGEAIVARLPATTVSGTFGGLDADGALLLDHADGRRQAISAGEVFFGTP